MFKLKEILVQLLEIRKHLLHLEMNTHQWGSYDQARPRNDAQLYEVQEQIDKLTKDKKEADE